MKKHELEEKYPGVADAVEREYPESIETIENISGVEVLASTNNGAFVYFVSATEDFYVIEGETGTGIFCRDKEDAELNWGGSWE
jgi:hypothetical protein